MMTGAKGSDSGATDTLTSSPVSTFNSWGRLREIIVGDGRNFTVPKRLDGVEISHRSFSDNTIHRKVQRFHRYKPNVYARDVGVYPEQIQDERAEDMDSFAKLIESFDVIVKRPRPLAAVQEINTPDWVNVTSPSSNMRDQFLVVGDEIIETPPQSRGRYFEGDHVKHILLDYFRRGARWTVTPRPRMLEESYDSSYFDELYFGEKSPERDENNFEIMFDGANCGRFGKDILFNVSNQNHVLGAIWLQRHLGERFKVHQVPLTEHHIDGTLIALRPGTFLMHRMVYEKRHLLPPALQKWDVILFEDEPDSASLDKDEFLACMDVSVNGVSIDEEKFIINEGAVNTIRALERAGFTPVPARLRHSRIHFGGFHCSTLDIRRDGGLERYF